MKQVLLFLAYLCIHSNSFGQDSVVVAVQLEDKRYADPIPNAKAAIEYNGTNVTKTTNNNGRVYFLVPNGVSVGFQFTHFKYYEAKYHRKTTAKHKEDTLVYTFTMDFMREQNLPEMIVAAPGIPVPYYKSDQLHVEDFEIQNNGDMILLTYPKQLKKGSELIVWDGNREKSHFEVDGLAQELVRDYRGNTHIVCENMVYGVHVTDEQVGLSTLDRLYFLKYLLPILDTNNTKMYFSNFSKDYPAFDYFAYDQLDSTYTKILQIKDDLMMELYRSEYKWVDVRTKLWAKNKEIETGVDAEIWVGANYFTQSIYYKELYAPLFHRNDTLFVFDYYKDKLRTFNSVGEKLDSVSIYHHYDKRNTGWQSNLIQDRITGQIYGIYDRAGYTYIGLVNTNTGEISEQVKLEYRYAHNVAVHNNHVYYIYRPFESPQKKYLYKERLPYGFGGAKMPADKVTMLEQQ